MIIFSPLTSIIYLILIPFILSYHFTHLKSSLRSSNTRLFSTTIKTESNERLSDENNSNKPQQISSPTPLVNIKNRINEIIPITSIEAIRFRIIKVTTEETAQYCKQLITNNIKTFEELASTISLADESIKSNGGDSGMVYIENITDTTTSIYPKHLINTICTMTKGEIKILNITTHSSQSVQQDIDWYIIQLLDIQTKLNINIKKRIYNTHQEFLLASSRSRLYKTLPPSTSTTILNTSPLTSSPPLPLFSHPSYYIETMGCQMNTADSERIEGNLQQLGYIQSNNIHTSSLIILNTCSIRDKSEQKVYSHLGPHALRKRKGEDVTIVIAGCVAQQVRGQNYESVNYMYIYIYIYMYYV